MRDLNFFDEYLEKREIKLNQGLLYFIGLGVVSICLIGYIAYNSFLIRAESNIVNGLAMMAENPEVLDRVEKITQKETELNNLEEELNRIRTFNEIIENKEQIDENLIKKINDNIPNGIFLTSLSIQKDDIYMIGISKNKWAVAEFQKNLKSLEDYEELFVSHITLEEENYNFAIEMILRGEEEDEEPDDENAEAATDEGAQEQ